MCGQDQEKNMRWRRLVLPLLLPILVALLLLYGLSACVVVEPAILSLARSSTATMSRVIQENLANSGPEYNGSPPYPKCAFWIKNTSPQQTISPGDAAQYKLLFINTGDYSGTLTLNFSSQKGWQVDGIPSSPIDLDLPWEKSYLAMLLHHAPVQAPDGAVDVVTITGTLVCRSTSLKPDVEVTTLTTTVRIAWYDVDLSPEHAVSAAAGETVHLVHALTHTSNNTEDFEIEAVSTLGWPITAPTTVQVAPSMTSFITVSVTVPPSAPLEQVDAIVVTATFEDYPTIYDQVIDQITVYCPIAIEPGIVKTVMVTEGTIRYGTVVTFTHLVENMSSSKYILDFYGSSLRGFVVTVPPPDSWEGGEAKPVAFSVTIPPGINLVWDTISVGARTQGATDYCAEAVDRIRDGRVFVPIIIRCDCPTESLCNGDFETGGLSPCWRYGGELPVTLTSCLSGRCALLGGAHYGCSSVPTGAAWLEQTFGTPVGPPIYGHPRLSFRYEMHTREHRGQDAFRVYLYENGNKHLILDKSYVGDKIGCIADPKVFFGTCDIDLTNPTDCDGYPISGDFLCTDVTIRFENHNSGDNWYNTWTYVDNVEFTW